MTPKWERSRTPAEVIEILGPERAQQALEDAKETAKLSKVLAEFEDTRRQGIVRVLYGPCPIPMDVDIRLSPSGTMRAYTVLWVGHAQSEWPPADSLFVLTRGTNDDVRAQSWLFKERSMVLELVKQLWGKELNLPDEAPN